MGVRIGQVAATLCAIACSGCGAGVGQVATPTTTTPPSPAVVTPVAPASEPPYLEPDEELRVLATRFVTLALGYDAWSEEQRDFLGRLQNLATTGETQRLRRSGRAHLRWWVLRQRLEQAWVHVTGVSRIPGTGDQVRLEVVAVRVTRSTVSTVQDFVEVALVAIHTTSGWRVDGAAGGGL